MNNQAVTIYISHQNAHAIGNILFEGNVADKSGGILITNNSNVFHNSLISDIKLSKNTAMHNGGLFIFKIIVIHITFKGSCMATIKRNQAVYGGGLYILNNSDVTFEGDSLITIAW